MNTFELTLNGFDGKTDETDHLIKWVNAPDRKALDAWMKEHALTGHLQEVQELSLCGREDGVDVVVGEDDFDPAPWKDESLYEVAKAIQGERP